MAFEICFGLHPWWQRGFRVGIALPQLKHGIRNLYNITQSNVASRLTQNVVMTLIIKGSHMPVHWLPLALQVPWHNAS